MVVGFHSMTGLESERWADLKGGTHWQICRSGTVELTSTNSSGRIGVPASAAEEQPPKLKIPSLSLSSPFLLISCLAGSREEDQG